MKESLSGYEGGLYVVSRRCADGVVWCGVVWTGGQLGSVFGANVAVLYDIVSWDDLQFRDTIETVTEKRNK